MEEARERQQSKQPPCRCPRTVCPSTCLQGLWFVAVACMLNLPSRSGVHMYRNTAVEAPTATLGNTIQHLAITH